MEQTNAYLYKCQRSSDHISNIRLDDFVQSYIDYQQPDMTNMARHATRERLHWPRRASERQQEVGHICIF